MNFSVFVIELFDGLLSFAKNQKWSSSPINNPILSIFQLKIIFASLNPFKLFLKLNLFIILSSGKPGVKILYSIHKSSIIKLSLTFKFV